MNACRKPGEWQTYDIIFEAPRFDDNGQAAQAGLRHRAAQRRAGAEPLRAARATRPGTGRRSTRPIADKLPLHLQFHGNPVRFRNIWIREL